MSQKPFFVTIPHSGEQVPDLTPWLKNLPEVVLMRDVDRYVDQLYHPVLEKLKIPYVKTQWHRYAVDLNRIPEDVDTRTVEGTILTKGHERGFHWAVTTLSEKLIDVPMKKATHEQLKHLIYDPFHKQVEENYLNIRKNTGMHTIYHIDLHSMPSLGTNMHSDPGELRADIVISDCDQKSCNPKFRDLVISAYAVAGFKVGYNWPYKGGRVSQQYGKPEKGQQAIQVELNRKLYMDEDTKKKNSGFEKTQEKLGKAIEIIYQQLPDAVS